MQTIIVVLNPGKLENPDLDLCYCIPDRIDTEDGQPGPLMGIWLKTESAAENWPIIERVFQNEIFKGNDLSAAAEIYISENDTESLENCSLVCST